MSEYPSPPERASAADDPTELGKPDWKATFKAASHQVKSDDVASLSAGVAFRIFLSLFPALIAAVAIFSLVTSVQRIEQLVGELGRVAPQAVVTVIDQPLRELVSGDGGALGGVAIAGILAGLWAATSAAAALMRALSRAYNVEETRKFVRMRLMALALTIALVLALVGLLVLLVFGPQLEDALLGSLPWIIDALSSLARYLAAVVVLVVLFAFVYWVGPNRERPRWVWVSPGAVIGVLGWLLLSFLFSVYANNFADYEAYGALAGPAVVLIWLQLSMAVLLFGAEVNSELERYAERVAEVTAGAGFAVIDPMAALPEAGFAPPAPVPEPQSETPAPATSAAPATAPAAVPAETAPHSRGQRVQEPSRPRWPSSGVAGTAGAVFAVVRHRRRRRAGRA